MSTSELPQETEATTKLKELDDAARTTNFEKMKEILDYIDSSQLNEAHGDDGSNALITLIRHGKNKPRDFYKYVKLLIDTNVDINFKDKENRTALSWARETYINEQLYRLRLVEVDEVNSEDDKNKSDLINDSNKRLEQLKMTIELLEGKVKILDPESVLSSDWFKRLENYQKEGNIDYISGINKYTTTYENNKKFDPIEECFKEKWLIPIAYILDNDDTDGKIAEFRKCGAGNQDIITELILREDKGICELLCSILRKFQLKGHSYPECYRKIMNIMKNKNKSNLYSILNGKDYLKRTPLYYAIRCADAETVEELLKYGASLGSSIESVKFLIDNISPDVLKNHLDNCIEKHIEITPDKPRTETKFYDIDYRFIIPEPIQRNKCCTVWKKCWIWINCWCKCKKINNRNTDYPDDIEKEIIIPGQNEETPQRFHRKCKVDKYTINETDVIYYMSTSVRLKHLMKHPVISTFLLRKWKHLRMIFMIYFLFYILFLLCLIMYASVDYFHFMRKNTVFWVGIVLILLTCIRKIIELQVTNWSYLRHENYIIELLFIIFVAIGMFLHNNILRDFQKQLSAIASLLASFEFLIILSIFPCCSTNMAILRKVLFNYVKFLMWYSALLLGFASSFYILFHCKNLSFNNILESLFKTIVMTTGEFDSGSLNFGNDTTTLCINKIIFILFIFMIPIVLLNLLNGLAFNDIQIIKSDAEITGYITLANNIKLMEILIELIGLVRLVKYSRLFKIGDVCGYKLTKDEDSKLRYEFDSILENRKNSNRF